jgi:lysophospholipase L1-like esterase
MTSFTHYVALGDSMSSDHYPTCDLRGLDAPPAALDPVGAPSLLYGNADALWPGFAGRDVEHAWPGADFRNLTQDGAQIDDVATEELARIGQEAQEPHVLVTLTAGGNDLLDALLAGGALDKAVRRITRRYTELLDALNEALPRAMLVLTTVYDPTDGTGLLPGLEVHGALPLQHLDAFNRHVRETAAAFGAVLADVHRHFLGHGVRAPEAERWYWRNNLIEPNARGASEIRRVWWEAIVGVAPMTSSTAAHVR